ncbi:hypothetical protein HN747_03600 [archaeon]|jgi:hypothetical protein|nr:hypothetical protein [archaeon]
MKKGSDLRVIIPHDKKAQIWVETVTYTLIGLTIIGLLIAGIRPQIEKAQDKNLIKQIKESLEEINQKINEIRVIPGNQRKIILHIDKGAVTIDAENDLIVWRMMSSYEYSEPDLTITEGNLNITTVDGNPWEIVFELPFTSNITYDGLEISRELRETSTSYDLIIKNEGQNLDIRSMD